MTKIINKIIVSLTITDVICNVKENNILALKIHNTEQYIHNLTRCFFITTISLILLCLVTGRTSRAQVSVTSFRDKRHDMCDPRTSPICASVFHLNKNLTIYFPPKYTQNVQIKVVRLFTIHMY